MFGDRSRVCTRLICELAAWATGVVILTAPVAAHMDAAPMAQVIVVSPFDTDNLPEEEPPLPAIRSDQVVTGTNGSVSRHLDLQWNTLPGPDRRP
jgi:hypothetical protein